MNEYFFSCTGGFDIDKNLKVGRNYIKCPIRFHLPDGREVDLFVGLRVINPDGTEEYLHKTEDFEALGFYNQSYEEAEFIASEEENEDYEEEWRNRTGGLKPASPCPPIAQEMIKEFAATKNPDGTFNW